MSAHDGTGDDAAQGRSMHTSPSVDAARHPKTPWRRIAAWFVVSRLLILAFAAVALNAVPPGPFFETPDSVVDWFIRWDAGWFRDVIENGYSFHRDRMSNVNFLPAYPLLVRPLTLVLPVEMAGYLVSNALCLLAAALLWRLTHRVFASTRAGDGAVLFFLFGPVSVFFGTLYSESAFVVFATGCLLAALDDRWWLAGVLGAAAALSRSVGLLLVAPLLVLWWQRHVPAARFTFAGRRLWPEDDLGAPVPGTTGLRRWGALLACGLPAGGTLAFVAYLAWRFNEPRAYLISHQFAGHVSSYPWQLFGTHHFATLPLFYQVWLGAAVLSGFALLLLGLKVRLPLALTVFSLALCLLYWSVKSLEGMPRFLSIVVPFYCTLGWCYAQRPRLARALLAGSVTLLALSTALFVSGYWFT